MQISRAPSSSSVLLVPVGDAKEFLQVEHASDNNFIKSLVGAATVQVERYLGRALLTQAITLILDANEARREITLPYPPFVSLTSFKYFAVTDTSNTGTTVDSGSYYTAGTDPCRLLPYYGGWSIERPYHSHEIVYNAGYGAAGTSVPDDIILGVKMVVRNLWQGSLAEDGSVFTPDAVAVLQPYVEMATR